MPITSVKTKVLFRRDGHVALLSESLTQLHPRFNVGYREHALIQVLIQKTASHALWRILEYQVPKLLDQPPYFSLCSFLSSQKCAWRRPHVDYIASLSTLNSTLASSGRSKDLTSPAESWHLHRSSHPALSTILEKEESSLAATAP